MTPNLWSTNSSRPPSNWLLRTSSRAPWSSEEHSLNAWSAVPVLFSPLWGRIPVILLLPAWDRGGHLRGNTRWRHFAIGAAKSLITFAPVVIGLRCLSAHGRPGDLRYRILLGKGGSKGQGTETPFANQFRIWDREIRGQSEIRRLTKRGLWLILFRITHAHGATVAAC